MNDKGTDRSECLSACCPEASAAAAPSRTDERLAALARALGHPARIKIMRLLISRTECICGEICHELPWAQSTISQHLKVLKEAGLIRGEVDGPRVCYCVDPDVLREFRTLAGELKAGGDHV